MADAVAQSVSVKAVEPLMTTKAWSALSQHYQVVRDEHLLEQHVAGRDRSHLSPASKRVYLGPAEPWEGDVVFGGHLPVIANVSSGPIQQQRGGVLAVAPVT